jgi:xylulokinase
MAPSEGRVDGLTYVLALDLGSTNVKAALFHADRGCIGGAGLPVAYITREVIADGLYRAELDADLIWETTVALILETCAQAGIAAHDIDRIAVASQAQTFALLDNEEAALTPFYSWLDSRGEPYLADIAERLGAEFHHHCSFSSGMSEMHLAKLLWIRRTAPHLLDSARHVIHLPSYLLLRLTGLNILDHNLAGMSGLYSIPQGCWWSEALDLCGISPAQLPTLVPLGAPIAATRRCPDLPLSPELQVVMAGNDHTAGAFGNDCREGDIVVTLGTALVAYRFAGTAPGPYTPSGCWGPYPGGSFYELAVHSYGCLALDWARELLLPGLGVPAFMGLAQGAELTAAGEAVHRPTLFYPDRIGTDRAWVGTDDPSLRARAVLEGIGFSLRRLIVDDLGITAGLRTITAVGGGNRSAFWRQVLADILACAVHVGTGDARTGAAKMATADARCFTLQPKQTGSQEDTREAHPDPKAVHHYQVLYKRWLEGDPSSAD